MHWNREISEIPEKTKLFLLVDWLGSRKGPLAGIGSIEHSDWGTSVSFACFTDSSMDGHVRVTMPSPVKLNEIVGWALCGFDDEAPEDDKVVEDVVRKQFILADRSVAQLANDMKSIMESATIAAVYGDSTLMEQQLHAIADSATKSLEGFAKGIKFNGR